MLHFKKILTIKESSDQKDYTKYLVNFFRSHPSPSQQEIQDLANKLGIEVDKFEIMIYSLLGMVIGGIGKHQGANSDSYDANQLAKGIDIEMEHTDFDWIAKEIAKDHLEEDPMYYDHLEEMENKHADNSDIDAPKDENK